MTTQLSTKEFYRNSITEIIQAIDKEQVLRYLYIITADVGVEQGVLLKIPYTLGE